MLRIIRASDENMDELMRLRLDMLREVNKLDVSYEFPQNFVEDTKKYFSKGDQTTLIAVEDKAVACATICYFELMPTYDHPGGKRAHIMNVYTEKNFRRQGIASTLLYMLVEQAKEKGVTEITLDAAEDAESVYFKSGFVKNDESMVLDLGKLLKKNIELAEKTGCKLPGGCCG